MSKNTDTNSPEETVVAIAKVEDRLQAVELQKRDGELSLLWARSSEAGKPNWAQFAKECGLSVLHPEQSRQKGEKPVWIGFDSAGVAFYRLDVPAVEGGEMSSIVRLQAESRLPLPADQMELVWRAGQAVDGQMPVTMAAARSEPLRKFVEQIRMVDPERILLDCEGIVRSWREVFGGGHKKTVVLSVGSQSTRVCLVNHGQLENAMVVDVGMSDFDPDGSGKSETEATELFIQDVRSVLDLFECGEKELPISVLSDGRVSLDRMVSALQSSGLKVSSVLPNPNTLSGGGGLGTDGLYEYRVSIGLGLMALDDRPDALNLFKRLYQPAGAEEKSHWIYSPKVTCVIAAIMLFFMIAGSYGVDVIKASAIRARLNASLSDVEIRQLVDKQKLRKMIALERPDMLDLFNIVNDTGVSGIKLTGLHFKRGSLVTLNGQANTTDQLYAFEKALEKNSSIKSLTRPNSSVINSGSSNNRRGGNNRSSGTVTFTISFRYKNFSNKTGSSR